MKQKQLIKEFFQMFGVALQRNKKHIDPISIATTIESAKLQGVRFRTLHTVEKINAEGYWTDSGDIVVAAREVSVGMGFKTFEIAAAFCSPMDTFNREEGQFIAAKRLFATRMPIKSRMTIVLKKEESVKQAIKSGVIELAHNMNVPWMSGLTEEHLV